MTTPAVVQEVKTEVEKKKKKKVCNYVFIPLFSSSLPLFTAMVIAHMKSCLPV